MEGSALADLMRTFDASAIQHAIEAAYQLGRFEGFEQGQKAERDRILQAVALTATDAPAKQVSAPVGGGTTRPAPVKRAPKGLTQAVMDAVLRDAPSGLTIAEIGERAVARDPRVSPKTIYNIIGLNSHRYVQDGDRWFLVEKIESPMIGNGSPTIWSFAEGPKNTP